MLGYYVYAMYVHLVRISMCKGDDTRKRYNIMVYLKAVYE